MWSSNSTCAEWARAVEARGDLVEDEHDVPLVADAAHHGKMLGRIEVHRVRRLEDWLADHSSYLAVVGRRQAFRAQPPIRRRRPFPAWRRSSGSASSP